jgi:cytochrome c
MNNEMCSKSSRALWLGPLLLVLAGPCLAAVDADAAFELAKDNKCVKCHDVSRKKDAPAYRDIAAKYRDDPEAESKLTHHVTAGDMVKFTDGHQERHKKVKSDDPAEVRNLVFWIMSLPGGKKY